MLPIVILRPELRCTAKSRRSGWNQCGRLAAYGSTKCTTHGARKVPRFGVDAPNYKHGLRTEESIVKAKHTHERLKLLAIGVDLINSIPTITPEPLNQKQKSGVLQFVINQAAMNLRQKTELVRLEDKKKPRPSRKRSRT